MKKITVFTVLFAIFFVTGITLAKDKDEIETAVYYLGTFNLNSTKLTATLKKGILEIASKIPVDMPHGVVVEAFTNKVGTSAWTEEKRKKEQERADKRAEAVANGFLSVNPKIHIVSKIGIIYDPVKEEKGEPQVNELIAKIYVLTPVPNQAESKVAKEVSVLNAKFQESLNAISSNYMIFTNMQKDIDEIKKGIKNSDSSEIETQKKKQTQKKYLIIGIIVVGVILIIIVLKGDSKDNSVDPEKIVSAISSEIEDLKANLNIEIIEVEYRGNEYRVPIKKIGKNKFQSPLTYIDKSGVKKFFTGTWKTVKQETRRAFTRSQKKNYLISVNEADIIKNFRETIDSLIKNGIITETKGTQSA